ncbi:hypothetical protein AAFF_G00299770 [Aldrovandia affinis]|uniref:Glycosyltransferase 2-like domain-containing protein n=1 Tax=Aldrovandia affinis TaxID=143900 RepID=A0AAD7R8D0_9TELE|nr:hypothetical protein AAFF_G00299770 [Aldrovandia affinis]
MSERGERKLGESGVAHMKDGQQGLCSSGDDLLATPFSSLHLYPVGSTGEEGTVLFDIGVEFWGPAPPPPPRAEAAVPSPRLPSRELSSRTPKESPGPLFSETEGREEREQRRKEGGRLCMDWELSFIPLYSGLGVCRGQMPAGCGSTAQFSRRAEGGRLGGASRSISDTGLIDTMNSETPAESGEQDDCGPVKRRCADKLEQRELFGGGEEAADSGIDVSIILPVHNASYWLDECLQAVVQQDFQGTMELSVFDDASKDDSRAVIGRWTERLQERGIATVISGHDSALPKGVGYAKNQAVMQSSGRFLCFQDADDVMMPRRVRLQFEASLPNPACIVGCQVRREPEGSTERYTRWINSLSPEQLRTQVYTSHGPTVIMPTWFCARSWFQQVGTFHEGGKGVPEDLLFFYQSLRQGGGVASVEECLLVYRYHEQAASHSVLEETIWNLRVAFLQERVLGQWDSFTIWNAGKQGRKLYRCLSPANQKKVKGFCDVDENKIRKGVYTYEESKERPKPKVPVQHFRDASPPYIVCVKLDMTGGGLEENLLSLKLKEGLDYYHFN